MGIPACWLGWKWCLCIVVMVLLSAGHLYPQTRVRATNSNYDVNDWQSYSIARNIVSIALGNQYVYLGSLHSGILRFDQFQFTWDFPWTTSNGLADNTVWVVAYDKDTGLLWCATQKAICVYNPTARRWQNFFKDEIGIPVGDRVESIGIGKSNVFFVTRNQQTFEANKFGGVILTAKRKYRNLQVDRSIQWFGKITQRRQHFPQFFMANGYLFDSSGIIEGPDFRRAEIISSLEDEWGNFWIGTAGLGAGRGDIQSLQLNMLPFGLENPSVNALAFEGDILWIGGTGTGSLNRGITAWDFNRDEWRSYEQKNITDLYSNEVNAIAVNGKNVMFATNYGLSQYSAEKNRWRVFDRFDGLSDNQIFDVVVDDSSIWVGTASGIDRIWKYSLAKKDSVKIDHIIAGDIRLVEVYDLELMKNLLWAGTNNGIYVYDSRKDEGGFADEIGGPVSKLVTSVSNYGDELWFGSSRGIDVYNVKKKQWLGVPEARSFPNTPINQIVASKYVVWAATNNGVLKYSRNSKSWRKFTTADGLISNRVYSILLDGDYVWFGTDRGLTQFYWNSSHRID